MAVELHLPDLPEVPLSIETASARRAAPWHLRLRNAMSTYLPLLLMALLAAGTWWLSRMTPPPPGEAAREAPGSEPDYTMSNFMLERFDAQGRLRVRLEGSRLTHYPDSDRIEVEKPRFTAHAPDGQLSVATAERARTQGDMSEVQLLGSAQLRREAPVPLEVKSEFLHLFVTSEKLRSHLPARVRQGRNEWQVSGFEYDHGQGRLDFKGPARAVLWPQGTP